ncbi:hypothetical protein SAMN04515671_3080 [Nakamurella panacisegetis]|uniref:Uncharacterized protein n=1 Tax=Nakamurella panacisegetis TaxID=1090615 RepID=A0A1H0QHA5_9ACTN|nr:hypothetical protein [Nakamurella panacisegetis]SDP16109.1 hypothetical protein SAMN04515671_3080 [Nakamurella panacisegetis]
MPEDHPDDRHEVFLELTSGTRVIVGSNLPDRAAASLVANRWIVIAREEDGLHETHPGSGVVVRATSIIAIKAQVQPAKSFLRGPRDGSWL